MGLLVESNRRGGPLLQGELLTACSVQVDGKSVYYEAGGVAEEGPTLLLLHGLGSSGATWHGQLIGLAQSARCLVPDLLGHGRSEAGGLDTVSSYRQSILGFLDALAIRWPIVVAGVCLGAAIAVDLALHAPERVKGVVLVGATESHHELLQAVGRGEAPDQFVDRMFSPHASPRFKAEALRRWRLTSPMVRFQGLAAIQAYAFADHLCRVTQPVLCVNGDGTCAAANAQHVSIPGGSMVMAEKADGFNQAVVSFLTTAGLANSVIPTRHRPGGYRRKDSQGPKWKS